MPTRRFVCSLGSVACLTIALYVALVVPATGCVSMPLSSSEGHRHSEESAHASLCAWSCQMISQSGPTASVPPVVADLLATPVGLPHAPTHSIVHSASPSSRAPPVCSLG